MKAKILIPLAGLVFLCACKGKSNFEVGGSSGSADSDTGKAMDAVAKLVKTAGMTLKVRNVAQTEQQISKLTTAFDGMVIHQQMGSAAEGSRDVRISRDSVMRITSLNTSAGMTVKVPSLKMEKFMDSVATMGLYVTNRSLDVTDKTLDYLSAQMKLKSRDELIRQQKSGKVIIKDPTKVLNLDDDMIDQQISNRAINDGVKNSTVNLSFYQSNTINKEVIVNDDPSSYELPFSGRLLMACQNGWELFIDLLIGLANIWFFLLCGAILWFVLKTRSKRKSAPVTTGQI
jgi:hypothetical protein